MYFISLREESSKCPWKVASTATWVTKTCYMPKELLQLSMISLWTWESPSEGIWHFKIKHRVGKLAVTLSVTLSELFTSTFFPPEACDPVCCLFSLPGWKYQSHHKVGLFECVSFVLVVFDLTLQRRARFNCWFCGKTMGNREVTSCLCWHGGTSVQGAICGTRGAWEARFGGWLWKARILFLFSSTDTEQ